MFCSCFFAVLRKADCCKSVPSCIVQVRSVLYCTSPSLYRLYRQVRPSVHIVHRRPSFVSPSPPSKSIPSAVQVRSVRPSLVMSKTCSPRWAAVVARRLVVRLFDRAVVIRLLVGIGILIFARLIVVGIYRQDLFKPRCVLPGPRTE